MSEEFCCIAYYVIPALPPWACFFAVYTPFLTKVLHCIGLTTHVDKSVLKKPKSFVWQTLTSTLVFKFKVEKYSILLKKYRNSIVFLQDYNGQDYRWSPICSRSSYGLLLIWMKTFRVNEFNIFNRKEFSTLEGILHIYFCVFLECIIVSKTKVKMRKSRKFIHECFTFHLLSLSSSGHNERNIFIKNNNSRGEREYTCLYTVEKGRKPFMGFAVRKLFHWRDLQAHAWNAYFFFLFAVCY